jgi:hypothetical protein
MARWCDDEHLRASKVAARSVLLPEPDGSETLALRSTNHLTDRQSIQMGYSTRDFMGGAGLPLGWICIPRRSSMI